MYLPVCYALAIIIVVLLYDFRYLVKAAIPDVELIHCEIVDKDFGYFKECSLQNVKQSKYLNVWFSLRPKDVSNIMIQATLYRKDNKYRPYLYNDTIDFCDFMKTSKRHIFWNHAYNLIAKYSNINHTCPYNGDVIVKDFVFRKSTMKMVYIPRGRYMMMATFSVGGNNKARFKIVIRK